MILVDTSVLINFFRGNLTASVKKFKTIIENGIPFGITSFIFQEVLQGVKNEKELSLLYNYLSTQAFYHPADFIHSYSNAAKIFFKCRKNGITIRSSIDCLVAQIAIENDLFLLHDDKDFDNLKKVVKLKIY